MDEYEQALTEEIKNGRSMIEAIEKDWRCHKVDFAAYVIIKCRLEIKIENYQRNLKIYRKLKSKGEI